MSVAHTALRDVVDPAPKRWTREEYHRAGDAGLFDDQRVQLIAGEIITMSPMKEPHAVAILLMQRALEHVFGENNCIRCQLPLSLGEHSEPEPDLAVVLGSPRDYTTHPTSALLVVEVSDTTLAFDRGSKRLMYADAGIQEYWIVNHVDRCVEVLRTPRDGDYAQTLSLTADDRVAAVGAPSGSINVADILP